MYQKGLIEFIAVTGPMGVGKTYTAHALAERLGRPWQVVSIADRLKERVGSVFGVPVTKENKHIYRAMLQAAADANQALVSLHDGKIHQERWVHMLYEDLPKNAKVIIDDVRFLYELNYLWLRAYSQVWTIRLEASPATRISRIKARDGKEPSAAMLNHPSEHNLDEYEMWDCVINTEQDIKAIVDGILWRLNEEGFGYEQR